MWDTGSGGILCSLPPSIPVTTIFLFTKRSLPLFKCYFAPGKLKLNEPDSGKTWKSSYSEGLTLKTESPPQSESPMLFPYVTYLTQIMGSGTSVPTGLPQAIFWQSDVWEMVVQEQNWSPKWQLEPLRHPSLFPRRKKK